MHAPITYPRVKAGSRLRAAALASAETCDASQFSPSADDRLRCQSNRDHHYAPAPAPCADRSAASNASHHPLPRSDPPPAPPGAPTTPPHHRGRALPTTQQTALVLTGVTGHAQHKGNSITRSIKRSKRSGAPERRHASAMGRRNLVWQVAGEKTKNYSTQDTTDIVIPADSVFPRHPSVAQGPRPQSPRHSVTGRLTD